MSSAADEFDFEGDESLISSQGSLSSPCKSSVSSSSQRRTRTQRQKALSPLSPASNRSVGSLIPLQQSQQQQHDEEEEEEEAASIVSSRRTVRFSLSPSSARESLGASSISSYGGSPRRKRTKYDNESSLSNSVVSSLPQHSQDILTNGGNEELSLSGSIKSNGSTVTSSSRRSTASSRRSRHSYGSSASNGSWSSNSPQVMTSSQSMIRGAGIDAWAVQDAGSFRELFDDLHYKCSTIVLAKRSHKAAAACELALALSSKRNRLVLFSTPHGTNTALTAILDAVASCAPKPETWSCQHGETMQYNNNNQEANQQPEAYMTVRNSLIANTKTKRQADTMTSELMATNNKSCLLDEALAAVAHFLSWDCTTSEFSSGPSAARRVRKQILQHGGAVRGVCHIILVDHVVSRILANVSLTARQDKDSGSGTRNDDSSLPPPRESNTESIQNTPELPNSQDTPEQQTNKAQQTESTSSPPRVDPTSAGRRRRRRKKKRIPTRTMLDPIPELENVHNDTMNHGGLSQMSFTSQNDDDDDSTALRKRADKDDDNDSVSSVNSQSDRIQRNIAELRTRVVLSKEQDALESTATTCPCCCQDAENDNGLGFDIRFPASVALDAMSRIIAGKEGDEVSCIEGEEQEEEGHKDDGGDEDIDEQEEEQRRNPLLITNRLLLESDSLPLFARAMAETLAAVLITVQAADSKTSTCMACIRHLQGRVSSLASVIDGACCLSPENRRTLSSGDEESGSRLVSNLLLVLKTATFHRIALSSVVSPDKDESTFAAALDDIALSSIRTLTSLTHENHVACDQLMQSYHVNTDHDLAKPSESQLGLSIIAQVLYRAVHYHQSLCGTDSSCRKRSSAQQHWYDLVIFCLNTMTNAVESKDFKRVLADMALPNDDAFVSTNDGPNDRGSFLKWLSRWLVTETASFRDAVMKGSFGKKKPSSTWGGDLGSSDRHLEKHEEEHLVTAGNGFILLACLMTESTTDNDINPQRDKDLTERIRSTILSEMGLSDDDGDANTTGSSTMLIRNTLKAFCNFYHYSVGDLSVAVVAPVRKLIEQLETI